jgi:hypothetical protein
MNNNYIVWHGTPVRAIIQPYAFYYTGLILWSQRFTFMFDLGSNGGFSDGRTMCHGYHFVSSVDHPISDSVGLLVYDSMHTIYGKPVLYYKSFGTTSTLPRRGQGLG